MAETIFTKQNLGKVTAWVPVYTGSASLTFTSVTTSEAYYWQLAGVVYFFLKAVGTTGGVSSTNLRFTLPVLAAQTSQGLFGGALYVYDAGHQTGFWQNLNGTAIQVYKQSGGGWSLGAGRIFIIQGNYRAA